MLVSVLAALVGVEGLGLFTGAVFFFVQIFLQSSTSLTGAIVIFLTVMLVSAGILFTAVATALSKRWVGGPILTWQVLQIGPGVSFLEGGGFWPLVGLLAIGTSVVVLCLLIAHRASLRN